MVSLARFLVMVSNWTCRLSSTAHLFVWSVDPHPPYRALPCRPENDRIGPAKPRLVPHQPFDVRDRLLVRHLELPLLSHLSLLHVRICQLEMGHLL